MNVRHSREPDDISKVLHFHAFGQMYYPAIHNTWLCTWLKRY